MISYASDGGISDFGDDGDLPPSFLTPWAVDPNINIPENFVLTGIDLTSASLPDRMKHLMDDYAYWLSLVNRLGFNKTIFRFDDDHVLTLEILSRFFDSSHLGLLRVFHIFDKDKDAMITRAEIAEGLQQQGFYTSIGSQPADLAFSEFCDLLTRAGGTTGAPHPATFLVSPPEFLLALRCLRLAAVVHDYMHPDHADLNKDIIINYHEYREDKIGAHLPLEGPISFLFRAPDEELETNYRVHWIHAHDPTMRTVLALGVKYGLDPRFTLDVLSLWTQQALVDRSLSYIARSTGLEGESLPQTSVQNADAVFLDREWIFSIVPVLKLSEQSAATLEPYNDWLLQDLRKGGKSKVIPPDVFVEVENCNVAMFVTGQANAGTVISFSTEWSVLGEVDTSNDVENLEGAGANAGPVTPTGGVSRATSPVSASAEDFRVFSRVMTHLRTSYSHIRTGDTHTLFLKALWDITEDYLTVIQGYEAVLNIMRIRLFQKLDSLEHFEVQRIQACLKQTSLIFRLMRPVAAVVDVLEQREWSAEAKLYLSDLKANVSRFIDHVCTVRETAKLLNDQYRNYCETRTRRVLFLLTLVTTIFVPCIFITSLEGMNIVEMPEQHLQHSYLYFWMIVLSIISSLLIFYRKKKWI